MINTVVENMHTQVARTKSPTPVGGPKSRGIKEGLKGGLKRQIVGTAIRLNFKSNIIVTVLAGVPLLFPGLPAQEV